MQTEVKLCECGCGAPAPIAARTVKNRGYVAGQPQRFIKGHYHPASRARASFKHGNTVGKGGVVRMTREYRSWSMAKHRCADLNRKDYGGRGIKFLFVSFASFLAHIGPRPEGTTLDRYPNNDGNYEPGNVRWATAKEQASTRTWGNQYRRRA